MTGITQGELVLTIAAITIRDQVFNFGFCVQLIKLPPLKRPHLFSLHDQIIIPAATVSFVPSSTRIKLPVILFLR